MTLVQTGKLQRRPIVLVGSDYWQGLCQWMLQQLEAGAYIGEQDLAYLALVEDSDEAAAIRLESYRQECG